MLLFELGPGDLVGVVAELEGGALDLEPAHSAGAGHGGGPGHQADQDESGVHPAAAADDAGDDATSTSTNLTTKEPVGCCLLLYFYWKQKQAPKLKDIF